jgi:hypothetical protein
MLKKFTTLFALVLLSACSGGGGEDGRSTSSSSTSTTVTPTEVITSTAATGVTTQSSGQISIEIGTGDKISVSSDEQQYLKDYIIKVVDSRGFPVIGATITPRVDMLSYEKGAIPKGSTTASVTADCASEDGILNGVINDQLDSGEDINGDGKLTPRRAIVSLQAASFTTNSSGAIIIQMQYPKNYAFWTEVSLSATASVNGTEKSAKYDTFLPVLAGDFSSTSSAFARSPYGISNVCTDAL